MAAPQLEITDSREVIRGKLLQGNGWLSSLVNCNGQMTEMVDLFLEAPYWGPRTSFQRWWARQYNSILNVGSCDDPMGLGKKDVPTGLDLNVTHLDMDRWRLPNAVQADAHHLPFKDKAFEAVVMGDIHEHLVDPLGASLEAARVSSKCLVFTIFEEWRLPELGQQIELGMEFAEQDTRNHGFSSYAEYMAKQFPTTVVKDDHYQPHHFHINQFADGHIAAIHAALVERGWISRVYLKVPETVHEGHQWSNWLLAMERQ